MSKLEIFIDSGAFSAFQKGVQLNLQEYIAFLKDNLEYISIYSNLDVIGDPEQTLRNQKLMEEAGLKPLPCFHYGEPLRYLKYYIDNYEYIALGGMVPISTSALKEWLDNIFSNYLCDNTGMPRVKVHGFGLSAVTLLIRYPWYSVDSSSWIKVGAYGSILVPRYKNGKYDYHTGPLTVKVTTRPTKNPVNPVSKHLYALSKKEQQFVLDYINLKGFKLGKSEIFEKPKNYELKEGEKWASFIIRKRGTRLVERVIEPGLCNEYNQRKELCCIYFMDLERELPEWPWPFKTKSKRLNYGFRL